MQSWKRFEYRVRDVLQSLGYTAHRVPLSGSARLLKGDVVAEKGGIRLRIEVKSTRRRDRITIAREAIEKIASVQGGELGVLVFSLYRCRSVYGITAHGMLGTVCAHELRCRGSRYLQLSRSYLREHASAGVKLRFRDDAKSYLLLELSRLLEEIEAKQQDETSEGRAASPCRGA